MSSLTNNKSLYNFCIQILPYENSILLLYKNSVKCGKKKFIVRETSTYEGVR